MTSDGVTEGQEQLRYTSTSPEHESPRYVDDKGNSESSVVIVDEKTEGSLDTHWSAWIAVFCVMIVSAACIIMWTTASNAPVSFTEWLQCDYSKLNWLSNVSAICNSIFSIVAAWAFERFGPKACVVASGCLNLLGCWIRCIGILLSPEKRYPMMMLGQSIASLGGPFVYNVAPKFVSVWFAPKHRTTGSALATLSFGMVISPLIIPVLAPGPEQVPKTLLVVAIIATVCTIPIVLIPQKPPHAPSLSAVASRMSIWQGFKLVSKSLQFWSICIVSTVTVGMYCTLCILMVLAAIPYGYTEQLAGVGSSLMMASGLLGGTVLSYWAGKTSQHLLLIKLLMPMACVSYIMAVFQIVENAYGPYICVNILIGIFAIGVFPIQLEYACEMFYPVPESVISNIIWSLGTALMCIFTVISTSLVAGPDAIPPDNLDMSLVAMAVIFVSGSIPCIWLKGNMKRVAIDEEITLS